MKRRPFDRSKYRKIIVAASLGGLATAANMTPEQRIARSIKAANTRWARARARAAAAAAGDSGYPQPESPSLETAPLNPGVGEGVGL